MASPTALPLPFIQFTPSTFAMTGQSYSLTCTVQVVQYLAASPDVTWLAPGGRSLGNINGITMREAVENGNITTLRFTVDQLAESHTGNYTCRACISINKAAIEGHCGHVVAEVTLLGNINLQCSSICFNLAGNFFFSSRKSPRAAIYVSIRPLCESTMERASEHQWSYCKLHYTSAEVPTCEWIKRVGAGGN